MQLRLHRSVLHWALFFLLTFATLWKGGKALDATWILAGVASALTFADVLFVPKREKSPPSVLPWFLALAFLVWTFVSFLFSGTKNYGFDEVIQTASLFLLFRFALSIPASVLQRFRSHFARILSVTALVSCAVGIAVYTLQPVNRFVGTFFDYRFHTDYWPNAWAEFLLFVWPLLVWSLWGRKTEAKAPVAKVLVMALLMSCLLLSYSRGAFLCLLAQISFLVFVYLVRVGWSADCLQTIRRLVSVLLLSLLFFFAINQLRSRVNPVQSVLEKATFTASEGKSSVSERRQFWKQAIVLTNQKPLYGSGPYSFRFLQPALQTDVLATSDHAHNVFLKLAMERGIPAALLFFLLLCFCFFSGLRRMFMKPEETNSFLTLLLLTSVFGVFLHNLIDYNLQFVGICAPLWIGLGLLVDRSSYAKKSRFESSVSVLIAFTLIVFAASESRYLIISSFARRAERVRNYSEAIRLYAQTDASLFPRDSWLSRARILIQNGTTEEAQATIDEAMRLNPSDYRIWKLQGDLFIKEKDSAGALRAFSKAYDEGRYNDLGITRVLLELMKNDRKSLDARRHEFELLVNDFGLAIEQNTHFIDLSQNVEELQKICRLLARIYPVDASVYEELARRSMEHAQRERSRLSGRERGVLW